MATTKTTPPPAQSTLPPRATPGKPTRATVGPDNTRRMLREASNSATFFWVGIAFLIHLAIAGATSVDFIRDRMDPAGAEKRHAASAAAATQPSTTAPSATANPTPVAHTTAAKPGTTADPNLDDSQKKMIEKKENPVVKNITDTAKPSERPKEPTRRGLDDLDTDLK